MTKKRVMFFDRNEIHIQDVAYLINGKLMSGHSSSSTFHDFKILSFLIVKNQELEMSKKNQKVGPHTFWKLRCLLILSFP